MGPPSTRSTSMRPTSPSDTTSCPPGPTPSTRDFLDTRVLRPTPTLSLLKRPPRPPSTGEPRVPSTQLRTKLNADHAGLSPPPSPTRVLTSSRLESSSLFPSKNSSPATPTPWVATVDFNPTLSDTSSPTDKTPSPTTHTAPVTESPEDATNPSLPETLRILDTPTSPESPSPNLRLLLPRPQLPSPSRPTRWSSRCTPPESSTP